MQANIEIINCFHLNYNKEGGGNNVEQELNFVLNV